MLPNKWEGRVSIWLYIICKGYLGINIGSRYNRRHFGPGRLFCLTLMEICYV